MSFFQGKFEDMCFRDLFGISKLAYVPFKDEWETSGIPDETDDNMMRISFYKGNGIEFEGTSLRKVDVMDFMYSLIGVRFKDVTIINGHSVRTDDRWAFTMYFIKN